MSTENVNIEWVTKSGLACLKFTFGNKLTKNSAEEAIKKWKVIFSSMSDDKIVLIWDCSSLKDYEPMARVLWQKAMKQMGNQIECVYLISQSKLIRTGASLLSLFTKFALKSINSENEMGIRGVAPIL